MLRARRRFQLEGELQPTKKPAAKLAVLTSQVWFMGQLPVAEEAQQAAAI